MPGVVAERARVAALGLGLVWAGLAGAQSLPPLVAVIVAGDADNTGGHSIAHVSGLRFAP